MGFYGNGAHVFIYGDDFNLAGFAFLLKGGVVRPVGQFQSDGFIECSVESMLSDIEGQYGISELIVPAVADDKDNKLLKLMPKGYQSRAAATDPNFSECSIKRAIAISDGKLIESDYKGSAKLLERLRQVREEKPASAVLWAYMKGLYELLERQQSSGCTTVVTAQKRRRPPVVFGSYPRSITERRNLF